MDPKETIPPEVKEFAERNLKYVKMVLDSATSSRTDLKKVARELNLAPSPKETIYSECSVKLYRFTPVQKELAPVPLLIVPSLILRYYIMDLLSGHSLIEHLVNSGIDTYLVDWGTPGDEHGKLTFDDYVDVFLKRAVRQVRRRTGVEKINLLGQCLGGTIGAMYTALHQGEVRKLVCLTTPVDFEDAGLLGLWTKKETFDVDRVVDSFGFTVPSDFIHACFQFLDVKATVERYKKLYNNVLDADFLRYYKALDSWLTDKIPFPGQVFRKFIKGLYQDNLLAKGEFPINGRVADLKNVTCPVLNLVAQYDHVFPEKSAKAINGLISGPCEYHVIPTGHVTCVVLFPERKRTYSLISEFVQ